MRKNQEKRQSKTLLDILREEKTDKYQIFQTWAKALAPCKLPQ